MGRRTDHDNDEIDHNDPRLDQLLRGSNAVMFAGQQRTWLVSSLERLAGTWRTQHPAPTKHPTATLADLLALNALSTARIDTLLQSVALLVSTPLQVMQLHVLHGGRLVAVDCHWQRGGVATLTFDIVDVDGIERRFSSDSAHDLVLLKQLQTSRDDDDGHTLVSGFGALWMPFG